AAITTAKNKNGETSAGTTPKREKPPGSLPGRRLLKSDAERAAARRLARGDKRARTPSRLLSKLRNSPQSSPAEAARISKLSAEEVFAEYVDAVKEAASADAFNQRLPPELVALVDRAIEIGDASRSAAIALKPLLSLENKNARIGVLSAIGKLGPLASELTPEIAANLSTRNQRIRYSAQSALRRIGPRAESAIPALIGMIEEFATPRRGTRSTESSTLASIASKNPACLESNLSHAKVSVRVAVAEALFLMGPVAKPVTSVLTKALEDDDRSVRAFAAGTLLLCHGERSPGLFTLVEAARDPRDESELGVVAQVLHTTADHLSSAAKPLSGHFAKHATGKSSYSIRIFASALGRTGSPIAQSALLTYASTGDARVERVALRALLERPISTEALRSYAVEMSQSADPLNAMYAIELLARTSADAKPAIAAISRRLVESRFLSQFLRLAGRLGPRAAALAPKIREIRDTTGNTYSRLDASWALVRVGAADARCAELALEWLSGEDVVHPISLNTIETLGYTTKLSKEALPLLKSLAQGTNKRNAATAAAAWYRTGVDPEKALKILKELADSRSAEDRVAAAGALISQDDDPKIAALLDELEKDTSRSVRRLVQRGRRTPRLDRAP
ncbi:MAG: hypothetical protein AAF517_15675, partial [Planctomycetota bacterium]